MACRPGLDLGEIRATQVLQPLKGLHFRERGAGLEPFVALWSSGSLGASNERFELLPYHTGIVSRKIASVIDRIRLNKGFRKGFRNNLLSLEEFTCSADQLGCTQKYSPTGGIAKLVSNMRLCLFF